jgi:hypothetical protein
MNPDRVLRLSLKAKLWMKKPLIWPLQRCRWMTVVCCLLVLVPVREPAAPVCQTLADRTSCPGEDSKPLPAEDEESQAGKLAASTAAHRASKRKAFTRGHPKVPLAHSVIHPPLVLHRAVPWAWPASEHAGRNGVGAPLRC